MKHNYHERKQQQIENAKQQAAKNKLQAEELNKQAGEMQSYIPLGQPILIGHHSEQRHRKDLERIDGKFRRSAEALDKAAYYEEKAKTIEGNEAISGDDPDALKKLQDKLKELEGLQQFMKAANKCVRKKDKAGFLVLSGASEALWGELNRPDAFGGPGFPHFRLTNNNANIRRIRDRIQSLEQLATLQTGEMMINGVRLVQNVEANRVQLFFPAKPDETTRKKIRHAGFIWCPSEGAWQRRLKGYAVSIAEELLKSLSPVNE